MANFLKGIESDITNIGSKFVISKLTQNLTKETKGTMSNITAGASGFSDDAVKIFEAVVSAYTAGQGTATLDPVEFALLGKTFTFSDVLNVTAK